MAKYWRAKPKKTKRSKPISGEQRNYMSSEYIRWRKAVYARDKRHCMMCGKKTHRLNAHHIKRWADYPELRFEVSNGISLCIQHHRMVTGKEEQYETLLRSLIQDETQFDIKKLIYEQMNKENKPDENNS